MPHGWAGGSGQGGLRRAGLAASPTEDRWPSGALLAGTAAWIMSMKARLANLSEDLGEDVGRLHSMQPSAYQRRAHAFAPAGLGIRFQSGAPLKAGQRCGCDQPAPLTPMAVSRRVASDIAAAVCPSSTRADNALFNHLQAPGELASRA